MKRFLGVNQFFFVKSNVLILLTELFHLKPSNNRLLSLLLNYELYIDLPYWKCRSPTAHLPTSFIGSPPMFPLTGPLRMWAWGGQRLCQLSFAFVKVISDYAAPYLKIPESILLEVWARNYTETFFSGDPGSRSYIVHMGSNG